MMVTATSMMTAVWTMDMETEIVGIFESNRDVVMVVVMMMLLFETADRLVIDMPECSWNHVLLVVCSKMRVMAVCEIRACPEHLVYFRGINM